MPAPQAQGPHTPSPEGLDPCPSPSAANDHFPREWTPQSPGRQGPLQKTKNTTFTKLEARGKGKEEQVLASKHQPDDRAWPRPALQPRLRVQRRAAEQAQEPLLPEDGPPLPLKTTAVKRSNGGKSPSRPRKCNSMGSSHGLRTSKSLATPPSMQPKSVPPRITSELLSRWQSPRHGHQPSAGREPTPIIHPVPTQFHSYPLVPSQDRTQRRWGPGKAARGPRGGGAGPPGPKGQTDRAGSTAGAPGQPPLSEQGCWLDSA